MTIKIGTYLATPNSWGMGTTKDGKPHVFIQFKTEDGSITWNGHLTEKTKERTIGVLILCGFRDEELKWLTESDALDKDQEVSIVVDENTYEGKTSFQVSWVNATRKSLTKDETVKVLGGMDLKGIFASQFSEKGIKRRQRSASAVVAAEEIPF